MSLKLGLLGRNTSKNPIESLPVPPLFTLLIFKELEELVLVTTKFLSVPLPREIVSVWPVMVGVIVMSRVFGRWFGHRDGLRNAAGREKQVWASQADHRRGQAVFQDLQKKLDGLAGGDFFAGMAIFVNGATAVRKPIANHGEAPRCA